MKLNRVGWFTFVMILLFIVYELVRKIVCGSWNFEELVLGLLIANLGYSFYINSKLSEHIG